VFKFETQIQIKTVENIEEKTDCNQFIFKIWEDET